MKRRKQANPVWLFSVEEVVRLHNFHPNTIRAWVNEDNLRHYRKSRGGKIYLREDDARDFIARNYDTGQMLRTMVTIDLLRRYGAVQVL